MNAAAIVIVLHCDEVAELLGCATRTVDEHARTGNLPGLKFGDGGWVFPADALMQRLNEMAIAEAAERRERWSAANPSGAVASGGRSGRSPLGLPEA